MNPHEAEDALWEIAQLSHSRNCSRAVIALTVFALFPADTFAQQAPARPMDPFGGNASEDGYVRARDSSISPPPPAAEAPLVRFDSTGVLPGPVAVTSAKESVTVHWPDEENRKWTAEFSLNASAPLIVAITVNGAAVVTQAHPYYQISTGTRHGGWYEFFDFPPAHPEGTRSFHGRFSPRMARAATLGDRVEISFDGLSMGIFKGAIRYTFFPYSRLVEQAAVVSTQEADTAYLYDAAVSLTLASPPAVSYYDTQGILQDADASWTPLGNLERSDIARSLLAQATAALLSSLRRIAISFLAISPPT